MMREGAGTPDLYPRVRFRTSHGKSEAYLPGSGLAVWEIAWIAGLYDRDIDATMEHLGQDREVIEQGLAYTDDHADEIASEIAEHTVDSVEELRARFPDIPVLVVEVE